VLLKLSSQRALVVNPWPVLGAPAERLAVHQRDHEKLQRERQLMELAEAKARGAAVKRPVGRPCMLLQEQASSSHKPPPLQALPLGHPHRTSEDGKWVREGCFSDWGKHKCKHSAVVPPMQPMGSLPISLHSSSSSSSSSSQQWGALELTN